ISPWRVRLLIEAGGTTSRAPAPSNGKGDTTMRFMVLVKADKASEAGVMPSQELVAAMGKFNEEMAKAGVLLAGDGLQPSSKGARITFTGAKPLVTDGPFVETKELISGYWLLEVASRAEAVAWASRAPFASGAALEVRQVFETSDFPPEVLTPENAAREQALREELQGKAASGGGITSVTPYLNVRNANAAIDFYKRALGAVEATRMPGPDGKVMHAVLDVAGGTIFLSDMDGSQQPAGVAVALGLANPRALDALAARLAGAGGTIKFGPQDMPWGARYAELSDPFGHRWMFNAPLG